MELNEITIENIKLFICPLCNREIPRIELLISINGVEIGIQCSNCINKYKNEKLLNRQPYTFEKYIGLTNCKTHDQPGIEYCLDCCVWLCNECILANNVHENHSYLTMNMLVLCQEHNQPSKYYCFSCNKTQCFSCSLNCKNHQYLFLKQAQLSLDRSRINSFINHNNQLKDILTKGLEQNYSEMNTKIKEEIESFYQMNKNVNENLVIFCKALVNVIKLLKPITHYELNVVASSFEINHSKILLSGSDIISDYSILNKFFGKEFLFKKVIQCTNTIRENSDWVCSLVLL